MKSLTVLARRGGAIFVRLPLESQKAIEGGCSCPFCVSHPDLIPKWDTLAISKEKENSDFTWPVHMPEVRV